MNALHFNAGRRGSLLTEALVACSVVSIMAAALLAGISSLQRSFRASQHHATSQVQQSRLLGYIGRDLRRASTVKIDEINGAQRLTLTIPDYYDDGGQARDPRIRNDEIEYTEASLTTPDPVTVRYYKQDSTIYRSASRIGRATGTPVASESVTTIATDVQEFVPNYTDGGKQSIGVSVSFVPRFQLNPNDISGLRAASAVYATTLLRNKRH